MLKHNEKLEPQNTDDILRSDLMPNGFEFYNLGHLEAAAPIPKIDKIGTAGFIVTYRITGDELGFCAVGFEQAPESADNMSLLLELAGILIAKFATQMADVLSGSVELSPPHILNADQKRERLLFVSLTRAKELPENSVLKSFIYTPQKDAESSVNRANKMHVAYLPNTIGKA